MWDTDLHRASQRPFDFVNSIRFEQIAVLDVIEPFEPNTAFHPFADVFRIILFTFK